MSKLDEHHDQFDDRNLFLQVMLGLVSGSRTLETLLVARGRASLAPPTHPEARPDSFLDAVVGLVALSQRLSKHLDTAASVAPDVAPPPSVTQPLSLRSYLA